MMDQISTNSIFLIRFALQSHVIQGHQAKWVGMTLKEAMQDGLFKARFRKCSKLLPISGVVTKILILKVISAKSTCKLKCSTVFLYFSLFKPLQRILVSSQKQEDKKAIIPLYPKRFATSQILAKFLCSFKTNNPNSSHEICKYSELLPNFCGISIKTRKKLLSKCYQT